MTLRVTLPRTHKISNGKIMDQKLEREAVIELLGQLGDENDDTVLATARSLHAVIQEANVNWNDLLVPDGSVDTGSYEDEDEDVEDVEDVEDDEDEDEDEDVEDDEFVQSPVTDSSESMALINKMLNASNVSDALREELQGYKEDISENEFTTSDAAYLKVLAERLKS